MNDNPPSLDLTLNNHHIRESFFEYQTIVNEHLNAQWLWYDTTPFDRDHQTLTYRATQRVLADVGIVAPPIDEISIINMHHYAPATKTFYTIRSVINDATNYGTVNCWMCQREYPRKKHETHKERLLCDNCRKIAAEAQSRYAIEYVYLMSHNNAHLVKIGATRKTPEQRKKGIRGASVLHSIMVRDAYKAEHFFHKRFEEQRVTGEWFRLSNDDIQWVVGLYSDIDRIADQSGAVIWSAEK